MALLLALIIGFSFAGDLQAQTSNNVAFQGQLGYSQDLSDIWGWRNPADGKEYALVGTTNSFSIVDVSNPTNPVQVQNVPGANTIWRDIKTWGNYAYVTNEGSGGLLIVDLSGLPGSISTFNWNGGIGFSTAHNIYIDENGIAYLCGSNGGLGTVMIDVDANPTNPPVVGSYTLRYVHDLFVRGDTMWTGEINNGIFSVVDVSNKAAPTVLATQSTSSNFTHNLWLSDDGATVFTTDEVGGANVDAYDVSDLSDITELDRFRPPTGPSSIPHNTYVKDNFVLTAWYRDGLRIADATQPDNLIEVGFYDSSPFSGGGFNGAWGAYPYLPSGHVLISDIEEGLLVVTPTFTGAAYLEGSITDASSGAPLFNANITLDGTTTNSNLFGQYATGTGNGGSYTVTVARSGYVTQNISGVSLTAGSTTTLDVALIPSTAFTQSGQVRDQATGAGIAGAQVRLSSATGTFNTTTDGAGNFSIAGLPGDVYDVVAGKWGFEEVLLSGVSLTGPALTIDLEAGFVDQFNLDLGWTTSGTSSTGQWERGAPIGTDFSGLPVNPSVDQAADPGNACYVTGNGGGSAGTDDVDAGTAVLTSPVFDLSAALDPSIEYSRWWFNDGGSSSPNDSLVILLSNGSTSAVLEVVVDGDAAESSWADRSFRVADFLTPTATMQLILQTADRPSSGHLVEAGLDAFRVVDGGSSVCSAPVNRLATNLTPTSVRVTWDPVPGALGYQIQGRPAGVGSFRKLTTGTNFRDVNVLSPGNTYEWQVRVQCADGSISPFSPIETFSTPTLRDGLTSLSVYPNPARDRAVVETESVRPGPGEYRILSADGRTMAYAPVAWAGGMQRLELNLQGLPAGAYFVELKGNGWRQALPLQISSR
jgi:choice-of-anchor B domain-containing protein